MGVKNFLIKKEAERQLKNMPAEQRDMIMTLLDNNPDLFVKMSKEVEHKIKKEGKDQTLAMMEVGKKYQKELQEALGNPTQMRRKEDLPRKLTRPRERGLGAAWAAGEN